jgi:hypothetical protein
VVLQFWYSSKRPCVSVSCVLLCCVGGSLLIILNFWCQNFLFKSQHCPPVQLNGVSLVQPDKVKYQRLHLIRRLTYRKHITTKRRHLDLQLRKLYWILGRKSQLSLENKLLVYKAILKPIWTYGVQLCGTVSNFNIDILERFQFKVMRIITGAPWYVPNTLLRRDLYQCFPTFVRPRPGK